MDSGYRKSKTDDSITAALQQYVSKAESHQLLRSFSIDSTRTVMGYLPEIEHPGEAKRSPWRLICLLITAIVLIFGLGTVAIHGHKNSAALTWKHCGSSPLEAQQNDCVYDFIAGAFVPMACFDAELEEEFLKLKDWRFYGDQNGEQELSIASIKMDGGTEPLFVSVEYHWIHCTYTWRKLHRSRMLGTPIDDHIADYEHTAHCGRGLVSQCDFNDTRPIIAFLHHYTTCVA